MFLLTTSGRVGIAEQITGFRLWCFKNAVRALTSDLIGVILKLGVGGAFLIQTLSPAVLLAGPRGVFLGRAL